MKTEKGKIREKLSDEELDEIRKKMVTLSKDESQSMIENRRKKELSNQNSQTLLEIIRHICVENPQTVGIAYISELHEVFPEISESTLRSKVKRFESLGFVKATPLGIIIQIELTKNGDEYVLDKYLKSKQVKKK